MFFFGLGLFSLLSQIVLLRELVSWLGGDELFYALGLGFWLLLAGLGSLLLRHLQGVLKKFLGWCLLIIYPLFAPIVVIVLRFFLSRALPVGQIPGFSGSTLIIFLTLLFPAFFSGRLFYLGTKKWQDPNRAYLWETVGFFLAGLIFTFQLSQTGFPFPKGINYKTLRWRYPNLEKVIYSKGSQLIVTKRDDEKTIFSAGGPIFNSQKSDFHPLAARIFSHIERAGGRTLVFGDLHLANELSLKAYFEPVIYLQTEKKIGLEQNGYFRQGVEPQIGELNQFLKSSEGWNWVILVPGKPKTLAVNRYYTLETFDFIKQNLTSDGVCGLVFDLPVDYQSQEALRFGQVLYNTFNQVFEKMDLLIVEGRVVLVGSESEIKYDLRDSSGLLEMVLSDSRREELKQKLGKGDQINTDRHPLAYFNHHLFWQTMFSFQLPKLVKHLVWLIPISLVLILVDLARRLGEDKKLGLLVGVSGFILMSLEITLLFMFQTKFGNLYTYLGLIMGTVLLGMTLGVAAASQFRFNPTKTLFFYLPLGGFLLLNSWQMYIWIWLVLALFIGLVGGFVFACTNQLWLKKSNNQTFIYACDLFGSFFGAILTSTILLPKFGLPMFLFILLVLTLVPRLNL